jgi:hypothetical protein
MSRLHGYGLVTDDKSETPGKSIHLPLAVCLVPGSSNPELTQDWSPTNALLLRDFWFVAHPEASMPPVAGTPGSTFFDVCRAFFPTDLVGCSNPLGHAR